MKQLLNLMIFAILIIASLIIPINVNVFRLDMSNIVQSESDDAVLAPSTVSLTALAHDEDLMTFAIDSSRSLTQDEIDQLAFTASYTDYSGSERTATLSDFVYTSENQNQRIIYHIKDLKTPPIYRSESYTATVSLQGESLTLDANYFQPDARLKSNGKTAEQVSQVLIPVCYSAESLGISFPVYTAAQPGKNNFRRVLNTLATTPKYPHLIQRPRFPAVSYVWYSAGVLELRIIESNLSDFNDPATAKSALDNMLKTFEASKGDLVVNKITLLVNRARSSRAFGGINLANDFTVERTPRVYLPLLSDDHITWVPHAINATDSAQLAMQQIVDAYQNPKQATKRDEFAPLLAPSVKLESVQIVADSLKLTFNDALLNSFASRPDYAACFIEGLSLSATSLPFIETVEIYVGDSKLEQLGGYSFVSPLVAPMYFNVDRNYLN